MKELIKGKCHVDNNIKGHFFLSDVICSLLEAIFCKILYHTHKQHIKEAFFHKYGISLNGNGEEEEEILARKTIFHCACQENAKIKIK